MHRSVPTELGVLKKVQAQCKILINEGYEVFLACLDDTSRYIILNSSNIQVYEFNISNINKLIRDKFIFSEIEDFIIKNNISILYSRYSSYSLSAHYFYLNLKKKGVKCLLEIPTYPLSQRWTAVKQSLKRKKILTAIIQILNSSVGSLGIYFFKNSIDRIVNNNGYDMIWDIPVIQITNGIDVSSIPRRKHIYIKGKEKILVSSVANIARWHGFDRFIKGLHNYYKNKHKVEVYLELAGPGLEIEILKDLAVDLNVDKYVRFLGPTTGDALDELYCRTDIGISILGIHRNKMTTIDCLKSREFCARQLPFITQSAEKHFNDTTFALQFPSDESAIDIEKVVSFYNEISDNNSILDDLYTFAVDKCDWSVAFKNVVNYIKQI